MLSVTMLSVTILSVMILSIMILSVTMLSVMMLSVTMLRVIMLSVTMMSVTMLSVTMLTVASSPHTCMPSHTNRGGGGRSKLRVTLKYGRKKIVTKHAISRNRRWSKYLKINQNGRTVSLLLMTSLGVTIHHKT
jgi:hypothetical protein